jgi:hypothetical protein
MSKTEDNGDQWHPDLQWLATRHDTVEAVFVCGEWSLVIGDLHFYGSTLQDCAEQAQRRGIDIHWLKVTIA